MTEELIGNDSIVEMAEEDIPMIWSKKAISYKKGLKDLIEDEKIIVFPNIGVEQSTITMAYLFDYTKNEILIFSNSFNDPYSNHPDYIKSLDNCLKRNVKISLLVDELPNKNTDAYDKVKNYLMNFPQNGEIRQISPQGKDIIKSSFKDNVYCHFAVADNDKYLLEINSETKESLCSFHHPKVANRLSSLFLEIYNL